MLRFALPLMLAAAAWAQSITVYHTVTSVAVGSSRQFTAYVPLSPNTVTWSVNNVVGGSAVYGTVTQTGMYTAPVVAPPDNVVYVKATSTAYPNISGHATVTISQPTPWVWGSTPSSFPAGNFSLRLNGSAFTPGAIVLFGGGALPTTYVSPTDVRATGNVTVPGTYQVRVVNSGVGAVTSQPVNVTVTAAPAAPVTVTVNPSSATVALGGTQQFASSVANTSNTAVTWTATAGAISAAGLFTAPATMPASPTVTVRATSVASPSVFAQATVTLTAPSTPPPSGGGTPVTPSYISAARFLEQATFGPAPAEIARVQQMGIDAWLNEQFAMPESVIPNPGAQATGTMINQYMNRLAHAPDQLRQKAAYALGQIVVISANKNIYPDEMIPYLKLLSTHAFGNYKDLLKEITMSPTMGKYLDLANSSKPGVAGGANENYPRELLQLFSIGLVQLGPDGTPTSTPTYSQATLQQFALALTGWTYPTAPGQQPRQHNWEYFAGPMETREANHDTSAKTLLNGQTLPAGQTVMQDLDGVINNVFNHPNVGPFVATRLIRSLVTSNPSGPYIQRVAAKFNDNGAGVRGDMKAVLRAILTDPEARNDAPGATSGRLKEPFYFFLSLTRQLNGAISDNTGMAYALGNMAQYPLTPPSVFSFFSPLYRIPTQPGLFGPEFQIYTPTESVLRGNFAYQLLSNQLGAGWKVDLAPFQSLGGNPPALIDAVDKALLHGRMPADVRASIAKAVNAAYDNNQKVFTALYLTVLSGQYAVQQ